MTKKKEAQTVELFKEIERLNGLVRSANGRVGGFKSDANKSRLRILQLDQEIFNLKDDKKTLEASFNTATDDVRSESHRADKWRAIAFGLFAANAVILAGISFGIIG